MLKRLFSKEIGISPKLAAANIVVVAGAFVWYFIAYNLLNGLAQIGLLEPFEQLAVVGVNTAMIAVFALLGARFVGKFQSRGIFLSYWALAGVLISCIPLFLSTPSIVPLIIVSAILGAYFGFGMPATMGYFAATTVAENRATTGGFTFLAIGLGLALSSMIEPSMSTIWITSGILLFLRLASCLMFLSLRSEVKEAPREPFGRVSYAGITSNRAFRLYFIPWIMFNIVDYLTLPSTDRLIGNFALPFRGYATDLRVVEPVLIAVFAVITGFFADAKGRKRLAILGFASLGIGYASLSIFSSFPSWIFYTFADGIAWGILNVVFLFTLWGDLARGGNSEKLYVLGALPYLLSNFAYVLFDELGTYLHPIQIFTFASFFLFLAVLPLFYAPETLPEKIINKRELTIYVAKAQEIAEKYY